MGDLPVLRYAPSGIGFAGVCWGEYAPQLAPRRAVGAELRDKGNDRAARGTLGGESRFTRAGPP